MTYDNATTASTTGVTVAAVTNENTAVSATDRFFGFSVRSGRTITKPGSSARANNVFVTDDLGFVVAVPEPGSAVSLGWGVAMLLGFVRRRR